MLTTRIYNFLFTTETKIYSKRSLFWLGLSLIFAFIYSLIALQEAFSSEYIVQDDARQHIFWMSRFVDSELFPGDLIADYYQSIAPWGYKNFYHLFAWLGIEPLVFCKFVPVILCLIMTGYCFAVTLEILPIPFAGFVAALLFNQNLWLQDGVASATSKAFAYPLFFAFIYYWLRRSLIGVCLTIILMSWFYPSFVLIFAGVLFLQLWRIDGYLPKLNPDKKIYIFSCIGLLVSFVVLLPYLLSSSEYGPTTTLEQARQLPEFISGGRASFFHDDDPWRFWFNATRSGIKLPSALMPDLAYGGLLLPFLLKFPKKFALSQKIKPKLGYFNNLLLVSFGLFFAAHAFLFKLYLPSRYTQHTLKVVVIVAASIALMLLVSTILNWAINSQPYSAFKSFLALAITTLFIISLVTYPATRDDFIHTGYQVGRHPQLYKFFQQQPKDIMIASLATEASVIPSFSKRSILVSSEHAIPYHMGYYQPFRQRAIDLIEAQYTTDFLTVQNFITKYGVDFWLLEKFSLTPEYLEQNRWLLDHQTVTQTAIKNLRQGKQPLLTRIKDKCTAFQDADYTVIASNCINSQSSVNKIVGAQGLRPLSSKKRLISN
jgi:MFS family permease